MAIMAMLMAIHGNDKMGHNGHNNGNTNGHFMAILIAILAIIRE